MHLRSFSTSFYHLHFIYYHSIKLERPSNVTNTLTYYRWHLSKFDPEVAQVPTIAE